MKCLPVAKVKGIGHEARQVSLCLNVLIYKTGIIIYQPHGILLTKGWEQGVAMESPQ